MDVSTWTTAQITSTIVRLSEHKARATGTARDRLAGVLADLGAELNRRTPPGSIDPACLDQPPPPQSTHPASLDPPCLDQSPLPPLDGSGSAVPATAPSRRAHGPAGSPLAAVQGLQGLRAAQGDIKLAAGLLALLVNAQRVAVLASSVPDDGSPGAP
jgi:hypothetical protein